MITEKAKREYLHWLKTCSELGWSKKSMPMLADLWWKWHGDDGQLLAVERQTPLSETVGASHGA